MRSSVFWDVTQRIALVNQRFGTACVCLLFIGTNCLNPAIDSICHIEDLSSRVEQKQSNCNIYGLQECSTEKPAGEVTLYCPSHRVSLILTGQGGFTWTESPWGLLVRDRPKVGRATDTNRI